MSVLGERQWRFLFCVASRVVPETRDLGEVERAAFRAIVEEALGERPASLQRQFRLFLGVVRWLPALRYLAPLDRLNDARQDAVLTALQDFPVALVRKGFWGLKSLVFMGFYGRNEAGDRIGYRPSARGNEKLRTAS
ncbi:MAG: hypothetical protein HY303_02190 [Candidatus Wallbacteria bacterium]|nr:hypothetical protein [Candidatus Wallbacteria bacterium]